jgi:tripartite-type tricarboxylate transporter receptor subunit TctC
MAFQPARRLILGTALCLLGSTGAAFAQGTVPYPSKPIQMVVPFAAGSVTDILARIVAQRLGEALGQNVIVDNKPGADGNIGAAFAAAAPADGYTLLMGAASTNAINPSLHKNLRFDPLRDFAPITNVATVPNVLVVGPQVSARNVKEFIEAARSQKLTFASSGAGGSMHLSGELFKASTRTPDLLHIPYKGGSAPVTDVMGGRVSAMFCNLPLCLQHIRAGKLTALGVTSPKRSPLLPETPTIAEAGVPGYTVEGWFGLFAPAAVPKPIIQRLNAEVVKILNEPKVKEQLLAQGAEPAASSPEEFTAFVKKEHDRWARIIQDANITLQ